MHASEGLFIVSASVGSLDHSVTLVVTRSKVHSVGLAAMRLLGDVFKTAAATEYALNSLPLAVSHVRSNQASMTNNHGHSWTPKLSF